MFRLFVCDPTFVPHPPGDGLLILDRDSYADAKALCHKLRAEGRCVDLYHRDERGRLRLVSPAGHGVPHVGPPAEPEPYDWLDAETAEGEPVVTWPHDDWADDEPAVPGEPPKLGLDERGRGEVVEPWAWTADDGQVLTSDDVPLPPTGSARAG